MCFIIIHYGYFDDLLSVNRIFDKDKKQGMLYRYMLFWD